MSRDDFGTVGAATRAAIEKTLEFDAPIQALRVLLALIHSHSTWSRLTERTSRGKLRALTGMNEKGVKDGARWLREHGIVLWFPGGQVGGGDKFLSTATFPRSERGVPTGPGFSGDPGPPRPKGGSSQNQRGVPTGSKGGSCTDPLTSSPSVARRTTSASLRSPTTSAAAAAGKKQLHATLVRIAAHYGDTVPMAEVNTVVDYLAAVVPWALDDLATFAEGENKSIGDNPVALLEVLLGIEETDDGYNGALFTTLDKAASAIEGDRTLSHILQTGAFPPFACQDGAYWEATR